MSRLLLQGIVMTNKRIFNQLIFLHDEILCNEYVMSTEVDNKITVKHFKTVETKINISTQQVNVYTVYLICLNIYIYITYDMHILHNICTFHSRCKNGTVMSTKKACP